MNPLSLDPIVHDPLEVATEHPISLLKTRGRPPGVGLGVKLGPRVGSRPWALLRLQVGESLYFETMNVPYLMAQISTDIQRNGLKGKIEQSVFIAVQPTTKQVIELVRVLRKS